MIVLVIMDGFGIRKSKKFNAIKLAKTPNLNKFKWFYPYTTLKASGEAVGLPRGVMGNSEAGHLTIGSGRVIKQPLDIINSAILNCTFEDNEVLLSAISHTKKTGGALHIVAMLSSGGIHSSMNHVKTLVELAIDKGEDEIYLHCILDGRDSGVNDGAKFVRELEIICENTPCKIATIIGRAYAMDREGQWDRTQKAYNLMVYSKGKRSISAIDAINKSYENGITDEFVEPIFVQGGKNIQSGDSVIFTNLRKDRMRQFVSTFVDEEFDKFKTKNMKDLLLTSFVEYDDDFDGKVNVAFKTSLPENVLGQVIAKYNRKQFRVSETTKFPHITYYFNGGRDEPFEKEYRKLISTIPCLNYATLPRMRATEITEQVLNAIAKNKYDFILVNLSNCDMVGHTANLNATKVAVKIVDQCASAIAKATLLAGGECIITADHGNAEELADKNGEPKTTHTTNPVPFYLITKEKRKLKRNMELKNIAPTILDMMGLPIPKEMAESMLKH